MYICEAQWSFFFGIALYKTRILLLHFEDFSQKKKNALVSFETYTQKDMNISIGNMHGWIIMHIAYLLTRLALMRFSEKGSDKVT